MVTVLYKVCARILLIELLVPNDGFLKLTSLASSKTLLLLVQHSCGSPFPLAICIHFPRVKPTRARDYKVIRMLGSRKKNSESVVYFSSHAEQTCCPSLYGTRRHFGTLFLLSPVWSTICDQDFVTPTGHTVTVAQIKFKRDNDPNMVVFLKALSPQINATKI